MKRTATLIGAALVLTACAPEPEPFDKAAYAAHVETEVFSGFGGDNHDDLCAEGITWACPIRETRAEAGNAVEVMTRLRQHETSDAKSLARAYLASGPDDISSVTVYDNQDVAIDYWTRRDLGL